MLAERAPANLASLDAFFARTPISTTAALLQAIAADGPGVSDDELRALTAPTLIIGHERDVVHPFAHAKALAGLIPKARLVAITPKADDKQRHVADFQAALAEFLQEFL
jgi:pimeloyl-ACP methyl ester carboxylesterase